MRFLALSLIALVLIACGGSGPTHSTVQAALQSAGASAFVEGRNEGAVPQSYSAHAEFVVGDKSGQYFVCSDKAGCEAIYAYFAALKALAGPYLYQSRSGLVVVQLNSQIMPDAAAKIEAAIRGL